MRKFIFTLLLFSFANCFSQSKNKSLIKLIKSAEKILLTSHSDLSQQIMRKPVKGEKLYESKYFKDKLVPYDVHFEILSNNEPNNEIIQQSAILDSTLTKELISIIPDQTIRTDSLIVEVGAACFDPHHTIFIYKNKKWSYIDLCFGCRQYDFSKDLYINKKDFLATIEDWDELKEFFKKLNLTYKLFGL